MTTQRVFGVLAALFAAWVLAFSQLPNIWALRAQRMNHYSDLVYTGTLPLYLDDAAADWSFMRQAKEGRFFLSDLYTPDEHPRTYVNLLFWPLGTLARWFAVDVVAVYNASKLALGALLLALLYALARRLFEKPGERFACFFALVLAGGWEGPLAFLERHTSLHVSASGPGWWMPEISTMFSLILFPHLVAGFAALVGATLLMLRAWAPADSAFPRRAVFSAGAGAVLAVLTFFHPYDTVTAIGILIATPALIGVSERRWPRSEAAHALLAAAVATPAIAYNLGLLRSNPAVRAWDLQNVMSALSARELVMGLGVHLILAVAVLVRFRALNRAQLAMLGWLLSVLVLIHLPFRFQRRMMGGLQFPLAALATAAVVLLLVPLAARLFRSWRDGRLAIDRAGLRAVIVMALVAPLSAVTPIYVHREQWREVRKLGYPSWLAREERDTFRALDEMASNGSKAMASYEIGNLLPPFSGVAVFAGHHALTIDWSAKERDVRRFYSAGPGDDAWRRELLERWKLSYVLYTSRERALGGFDPSTRPWLEEVFVTGDVPERRAALYRVR